MVAGPYGKFYLYMKLIEAFLFSEVHERDLLLLKFKLSNGLIDEWIICENAYSHQGDYTGLIARNLIENDAAFEEYRNKIKYIEGNHQFDIIDKTKKQDNLAFKCENWQRELGYDYFMKNYDNEDCILIHDVDEMCDFTDKRRADEFFLKLKEIKHKGMMQVPRLRFWYDFDNKFEQLYGSVVCSKSFLLRNPRLTFSEMRRLYTSQPDSGWNNIIVFEYSSCYTFDALMRKMDTNPHTGVNRQAVERALRCNHRAIPLFDLEKKLKPTRKFFFEKVKLDETNSPQYVRDNLQNLRTNIVDENYQQNREREYPHFYTLKYKLIDANIDSFKKIRKKFLKKIRFLSRKLKVEKLIYGS